MKKIVSLVLALMMLLSLAPASAEATKTFRFSLSNSAESMHGQNITRMCETTDADRAAGKTGLEIEIYANGQLGSVDEILEQVLMGEDVMLSTDAAALKNFAPELGILEAPYFFENLEEPALVFGTEWFQEQLAILDEVGIKVLSAEMIYGARHIVCNTALRTPDDIKGLKIRVPANELSTSMIEAMGGTPTPMSLSEVYPAIQQKTIDGMENPFATHIDSKMDEVCSTLSMTGHQITTSWYVMSSAVFHSLPEAEQEYLMNLAKDAAAYFNSINGAENDRCKQLLADRGMTIVEDVDVPAFKAATASVYDKLGYTELRQEIYAQMDAFR